MIKRIWIQSDSAPLTVKATQFHARINVGFRQGSP